MTFEYSYRGSNGALITDKAEAADRKALLAALACKGISSVVAIRETSDSAPAPVNARSSASARKLVVIGAAVVCVLVILYFFLHGGTKSVKVPKTSGRSTAGTTAVAPERVAGHRRHFAMTNQPPKMVSPLVVKPHPMPTNGKEPMVVSYGQVNGKPAAFKSRPDQLIAMIAGVQPGDRILDVGFGPHFDEEFKASLTNTIELLDSDTPAERTQKQYVMDVREQLKTFMAEGKSPEAVLKDYRDDMNRMASYRDFLQQELIKVKKTGSRQDAEDFVAAANEMLEKKGIKPLKLGLMLKGKDGGGNAAR